MYWKKLDFIYSFLPQIPAKYLLGDGSVQDENREKFIQARKEKLR